MSELLPTGPWTTTALFALAAALAASVARTVLRATLKRLARGNPLPLCMLAATERAGAAAFPMVALLLVWQGAPDNQPCCDRAERHFPAADRLSDVVHRRRQAAWSMA